MIQEIVLCGGMLVATLYIVGMWAVMLSPRDHSDEYYYDWKAKYGRDEEDDDRADR